MKKNFNIRNIIDRRLTVIVVTIAYRKLAIVPLCTSLIFRLWFCSALNRKPIILTCRSVLSFLFSFSFLLCYCMASLRNLYFGFKGHLSKSFFLHSNYIYIYMYFFLISVFVYVCMRACLCVRAFTSPSVCLSVCVCLCLYAFLQ